MRAIRFKSLPGLLSGRGLAGLGFVFALAMFSCQSLQRLDRQDHVGASTQARSPSYPPAMGGPDNFPVRDRSATSIRRAIIESDDLLQGVIAVGPMSPTAAKLAASDVLMACFSFRQSKRPVSGQYAAFSALLTRCASVRRHFRRNDAIQLAIDLQISAEGDTSLLGRLASLAQQSQNQIGGDEQQMITDGLRSGDAVVLRMAGDLVSTRLGRGLRDEEWLRVAFERALLRYAQENGYEQNPIDALAACASRGCRSGPDSDDMEEVTIGVREALEIERLTALYFTALQQSRDMGYLIAIR
jgi:hypothetical protein